MEKKREQFLERGFVRIPAGVVKIAGKPHKTAVRPFEIMNTPVTVRDYSLFLESSSDAVEPFNWDRQIISLDKPVVGITWEEAVLFCKWFGARLPTEAEWQLAAQGGELCQRFSGTNDEKELDQYAVCGDYLRTSPAVVGRKQPNKFGLYDMSGNVWEMCSDFHEASDWLIVARGGSWIDSPELCSCNYRLPLNRKETSPFIGFRMARNVFFWEPRLVKGTIINESDYVND